MATTSSTATDMGGINKSSGRQSTRKTLRLNAEPFCELSQPGKRTSMDIRCFGSLLDQKEARHLEELAERLATDRHEGRKPPQAAEYISKAAPAVFYALVDVVGPGVIQISSRCCEIYRTLPRDLSAAFWGLALCFFGGRYAVSAAAIEAFQTAGGSEVALCLQEIKEEFELLQEAHARDEEGLSDVSSRSLAEICADETGSTLGITAGIVVGTAAASGSSAALSSSNLPRIASDRKLLEPRLLAAHKLDLVLTTVDPERLSRAIGGIWTGYMGVLVVLKYKFAETVALAHSLGNSLRPLAGSFLGPSLLATTPPKYHKWISPLINTLCKLVAMSLAWRIRRTISALESGVRGGLLAAQALMLWLQEHKYVSPSDASSGDDSAVLGWCLAGSGIYFQIVRGGAVPLLFKPFLWPLDLLEWWLTWSVTYRDL